MTHTYKVTGMTCANCETQLKSNLLMVANITGVKVSKDEQMATITMDKHVPLSTLQNALGKKYKITAEEHSELTEKAKSWLSTYKPILLIGTYITGITLFVEITNENFNLDNWMQNFMAGFFLTFSFFKLLDIKGFAESYSTYDIVARRWVPWGYIYAFIELGLGLAFLLRFNPLLTNGVTFAVMSISIIGVLQTVFNKRKIRCACLGAVFNLPMSTITIIEDALMIAMSAVMVITMI